ncbi:MAG: response regulator [Haloferacaceae archaeon]
MSDSIRVLHVDDDPDVAELTATFLERGHDRFSVRTATSVSEALDRFSPSDFDCIVSDYEMPGRNGIEFLETIRETYPDFPFILYTGKGSEEIASVAISKGVTEYLQKKPGTDQYAILANRIENAVEGYRSERTLAEHNEELRIYERIFHTMQEGACLYDTAGTFEIVNDYLADFYGTSRDSLVGQSSELVTHVRERGDDDRFQAMVEGDRSRLQGEAEIVVNDQRREVVDYRFTPLTVDGDVEGVVGVARVITERKRREQELEQTNTVLRTILENLPDGVLVEDPSREVLAVNAAFLDIFDADGDPDDYVGADCAALAESLRDQFADPAGFVDGIEAHLADRRPAFREELELTDGRVLERDYVPYTLSDEAANLWIYRDVTDRLKHERKLQRQNDRLDEFASVVSHDLRNPLNLAQGELELAREERDSEHLAAVATAHERMEALIEDLLTLAREGERVRQTESVDVGALLDACWRTVETDDATMQVRIDRRIEADESRFQQLLENLLRNAVEHGGDDVTVTVGELDEGFYVADDGPGIPPAERETVMNAGYSTAERGTGFGLAIVKRIADAHGWDVRVTESDDGGARFEFAGVTFDT